MKSVEGTTSDIARHQFIAFQYGIRNILTGMSNLFMLLQIIIFKTKTSCLQLTISCKQDVFISELKINHYCASYGKQKAYSD